VAEEHAKRDATWYAERGCLGPPAYETSNCTRFDLADSVGWLGHLDVHGFVVIVEVVTRAEVEHACDLMWTFLEKGTSMRRGDASSWTDEAFEAFGDVKKGICAGLHIGHSELCWFLRCLPTERAERV